MATARLLAALAVARAAYVQPKGLVRRVGRDVVPNATNINAQQAKDVVTSGVDSQWVKHLGPTDSLEACARLCRAYDFRNGTRVRRADIRADESRTPVAATTWVETSHGDAAAATWIFRVAVAALPRLRRG